MENGIVKLEANRCYNSIMKVLRVDEFDEEFITDKLIEIYEDTEDYLWFSTSLHPEFFSREDIRDTISDLCDRGVTINILLDEEVSAEERRQELPWVFENDCIEIKQSENEIPHRVISDGDHLRLEKPHTIQQKGAANLIAMNAVGGFREPYINEFEEWWESALLIEHR